MEIDIRPVGEDDLELFETTVAASFGDEIPPEALARLRRITDLGRQLGAYDGDKLVGGADAHRLTLTVPGGEAPAAGVTTVGVLPTHRRRGILTGLMRRQLDDLHEAGEPVAVLWASEGGIYPRFGYGLAIRNARLDAERDRMRFFETGEPAARARLLKREEALEALPPLYDQVRAISPGFFTRSADWWDVHTLAGNWWERSPRPVIAVLIEIDGRPAAYALYTVEDSGQGVGGRRLRVKEEISTSPEAQRAVWRYLFGVDLVARVQAPRVAADHPLFLSVTEPSRLHYSAGDGLFLRLVDVPAALAARTYAADGALTFELRDAFCPWNEGVWRLDASRAGAATTPASDPPDLRLTAADLAAVYLGGFTFTDLLWAGRVEELRPGAIARADELFRTPRAPWCPELF